jgi:integrase
VWRRETWTLPSASFGSGSSTSRPGCEHAPWTIQVPEWLMDAIEATCPLEDRTAERKVFQRKVFQGLKDDTGRKRMAIACRNAGIPYFSPKNLRERRAPIWHHDGVVAKTLAERLGHSKASMSLDVYTHTVRVEEVPVEELVFRVTA